MPLPSGSTGLPLVGQTLAFLKDEFHFVANGIAEHGPVFRTHVLGRDAAILAGPEATEAFNNDEFIQRKGGMPAFIEQFIGASLPFLDGETHRTRKQQVLGAFTPEALKSYMPTIQSSIETTFSDWSARGELSATAELKRLSVQTIMKTMASVDPGPDLDTTLSGFAAITKAFSALPIPLPGTAYTNGQKGRDAIFEVLRRTVKGHRDKKYEDGLGRMLETQAKDGSRIQDEDAVLELHHFNIAGYIVYTMFATVLVELARHPDIKQRLIEEVLRVSADGPITIEQLMQMDYLEQVVKEVKRYTPLIPVFFGTAKKTFEFSGRTIPEGWMVLWGHHSSNHFKATYKDPERFDPDRFSKERAEDKSHPHAYAPQGTGPIAGGHKCAGFDFANIFLQMYVIALLRGFDWKLPEQDLSYFYGMVPPEHRGGVRVIFSRKTIA